MTLPFASFIPWRRAWRTGVAAWLACLPLLAHADAADALRNFAKQVQSARADFTQTVSSPDGAKKKTSSGRFEFLRPNRFRFDYLKPYEQQIVADGQKVWLYDPDLNQVTVRGFDQALGATPAAVLAGASIERDFTLQNLPDQGGLQWVQATPKAKEGSIRQLRVAFRGNELGALEIVDAFGQQSRLDFSRLDTNPAQPAVSAQRFHFQVPAGADVVQQ